MVLQQFPNPSSLDPRYGPNPCFPQSGSFRQSGSSSPHTRLRLNLLKTVTPPASTSLASWSVSCREARGARGIRDLLAFHIITNRCGVATFHQSVSSQSRWIASEGGFARVFCAFVPDDDVQTPTQPTYVTTPRTVCLLGIVQQQGCSVKLESGGTSCHPQCRLITEGKSALYMSVAYKPRVPRTLPTTHPRSNQLCYLTFISSLEHFEQHSLAIHFLPSFRAYIFTL